MAKSVTVSKTTQEGTSLDILVKEGKALYSIWRQTNSLKDSTKAKGFDTRLGKLLQQLKAQSTVDSGQISRQTLATYHVDKIDRRRRSEALWFVENEVECRDFIKKSKKGFTSLTALQAAMRKAAKGSDEDQTAKAEPSNVGQSDEAPAKADKAPVKITHKVMVNTILAQTELNGLDLEKIIEDLMAAIPAAKAAA